MTLKRQRVGIYVEIETTSPAQMDAFLRRFMDAIGPVLQKTIRRTDTPTLSVDDVPVTMVPEQP